MAGQVWLALTVDSQDVGYNVCLVLDNRAPLEDAADVLLDPEPVTPAGVLPVLYATSGVLWELVCAAERRGDERSWLLWQRAYESLSLYRQAWHDALEQDEAAPSVPVTEPPALAYAS